MKMPTAGGMFQFLHGVIQVNQNKDNAVMLTAAAAASAHTAAATNEYQKHTDDFFAAARHMSAQAA